MTEYTQLSFDFMTNFEDTGKFVGKVGIFKTKVCTRCKKEFEATKENFNKSIHTKDKLDPRCKRCVNEKVKKICNSKIKEGIFCRSCTEIKLPSSQCCTYHAIYSVLSNQIRNGRFQHLKTKDQKRFYVEKLIEKIEQQEYKCAITGVPIELGRNAQLDHIIEIVNGGSCQLDNLQWVDIKINKTKAWKYKND